MLGGAEAIRQAHSRGRERKAMQGLETDLVKDAQSLVDG